MLPLKGKGHSKTAAKLFLITPTTLTRMMKDLPLSSLMPNQGLSKTPTISERFIMSKK